MTHKNILHTIGNTPLVLIRKLNPFKDVKIYAKLESFNPGGSIKDRIALSMIEGAEKRGELTKDKIVLEASSGNTGIGLALVCAVKGYRCLIAMSEGASLERRQIMEAYGADILLTPAELSTDGAIEAVYNLALKEPERYFLVDQFNNPDNWKAHYNGTAMEIWEQTEGNLNAVVATMGTTGTLMGLTRRMKELNPDINIIGIEPYLGHKIQGLKNMKESYVPGIFDKSLPDQIINVHDEEAFELTKKLAKEEGLFVGMSSGAALAGALKIAAKIKKGTIVTIFADGGERYLSTGLFSNPEKETPDKEYLLRLTNTLTRKREIFQPVNKDNGVGIYSCGPTAYEYTHLGLARRVVVADLLKRVLEFHNYETKHVMNITDIDDKTISAAINKGISLKELTDHYAKAFLEDITCLGVKPAYAYPRASEHIPQMINLAQRLIDSNYAYVRHGSVYFDVSKLDSYGQLSRIDMDGIDLGRTVDLDNYEKDSPADFTIFKRVTLQELKLGIGYDTPWGKARPGWHIECVAMSQEYLGEFFDIHTSGTDLVFPHHENEIAMAMALTGKPLANKWLHSALILVNGKKMSRSAGNVVTVRDLLKQGYSGREIRFYLLRTHYRKPIQYSRSFLKESTKALRRLDQFISELVYLSKADHTPEEKKQNLDQELEELRKKFLHALNDDLNVSLAIGALFHFIKKMNPSLSSRTISSKNALTILDSLEELDKILSILNIKDVNKGFTPQVISLIKEREQARKQKKWDLADQLRNRLQDIGIEVLDTPTGTRYRKMCKGGCIK